MFKKVLLAALKFGAPLFLVAMPAIAIYGLMFPWEKSEEALAKYNESASILTGLRYQSSDRGEASYSKQSRTYLVLEGIPPNTKTVMVTARSDGHVEVDEKDGGLFALLATYVALIFVTWWFWFRSERNTHNKSPQPTAYGGG